MDRLSSDELRVWHAFKIGSEAIQLAVERAVADAAGLTGPEFGVLDRLDLAGGVLRQSDLAVSMRWHKSRLSHQLTRMSARKLIERTTVSPSSATVHITEHGLHTLHLARPAHARAIREHLTSRVPKQIRHAFIDVFKIESPH
jgi:DNA-binding MarR family transcriptional regulator